jgi:hypothetical protein
MYTPNIQIATKVRMVRIGTNTDMHVQERNIRSLLYHL